ncbi:ABC transporter ATP-binding protein [Holosporaceae bacterium 'Namur']|nr:ABC transporter ATP-binding protein [Holosporaceae bacterium 'Namur']
MQHAVKSVKNFIWHFVKKQKGGFIFTQVFALALALDATLWPYVIKVIIETIEGFQGPREEIWPVISHVIILGLILWFSLDIAFWINGIFKTKVYPRFEAAIRMFMYDYVNSHSYSFFINNFTGTIANKVADMPRSCGAIVDMAITTFIPTFVALIISIIFFSFISPVFALILGGWVIIHIISCYFFLRKCTSYSTIHSESRSRLLGRIVDTITNNLNVRLFSRNTYEYQYTLEFQEDERKKYAETLWHIEKMRLILALICFLITGVLMIWYEVYSYRKGIIDIAEFIFILNTTFQITSITWMAGIMLPDFFREVGIARQALSIINSPVEIKDLPNAQELKVDRGEIKFNNVTFKYHHNENLFENKSVTILPGQRVGLVGVSGSGKTTFAHLILRHYELEGGEILIDGQDIRNVTQESLRRQIAMIPQEPMLFHRSLKENIRYGDITASDEQVYRAAKIANCHEFIMSLPQGYDTIAGERGSKLSGGQRQRISIARAMLKNAPIIILDEATSALDSITEKQIQSSLMQVTHNRTTIIIAHRFSTLTDVDRIIVFKKGDIVEDGSHEELFKKRGEYYKLWEMQNDGFLPKELIDE